MWQLSSILLLLPLPGTVNWNILPCNSSTWTACSHEFVISVSTVNVMSYSETGVNFWSSVPVTGKRSPARFCHSVIRCPWGGSVEINDPITRCGMAYVLLCHKRVFHATYLCMYLSSTRCQFWTGSATMPCSPVRIKVAQHWNSSFKSTIREEINYVPFSVFMMIQMALWLCTIHSSVCPSK